MKVILRDNEIVLGNNNPELQLECRRRFSAPTRYADHVFTRLTSCLQYHGDR
jgi:hypothetical protein